MTNCASGEIIAVNIESGTKKVIATKLNLPVGVTQLPNGDLIVSQYSGKLTHINTTGIHKQLGAGFNRPCVGTITVSDGIVVVIDNGVGAVRLVNINTGLDGAVVLGYYNHHYYVGTWNDGKIHNFE